jgi:hypothetical protein
VTTDLWDDETRRAIAQSLSAFRGIDPNAFKGMVEAAQNATATWAKIGADIHRSLSSVVQNMAVAQTALNSAFSSLGDVFSEIAKQDKQAKLLESGRWLPHSTMPFHLLTADMNPDEVDAIVLQYFAVNWQAVEEAFVGRVCSYAIDEEAKATFREALKAHELGLYRVAPRLLFPELERVGVDEFHDGQHFEVNARGKPVGKASLKEIRNIFGKLPAGVTFRFPYGWRLYKKVQSHLYEAVQMSEQISTAKENSVPNRHAALHGIVQYNTPQTSLNAIIMADFMFHLMDRLKYYVESSNNDDG